MPGAAGAATGERQWARWLLYIVKKLKDLGWEEYHWGGGGSSVCYHRYKVLPTPDNADTFKVQAPAPEGTSRLVEGLSHTAQQNPFLVSFPHEHTHTHLHG
jgi:hypothetical protein